MILGFYHGGQTPAFPAPPPSPPRGSGPFWPALTIGLVVLAFALGLFLPL